MNTVIQIIPQPKLQNKILYIEINPNPIKPSQYQLVIVTKNSKSYLGFFSNINNRCMLIPALSNNLPMPMSTDAAYFAVKNQIIDHD